MPEASLSPPRTDGVYVESRAAFSESQPIGGPSVILGPRRCADTELILVIHSCGSVLMSSTGITPQRASASVDEPMPDLEDDELHDARAQAKLTLRLFLQLVF